MNLKECFEAFEGSYDEVMGRLLTEERVKKFLLMFLKDTSFSELEAAMQNQDCDSAFRAAHTLKGVCSNLGITKLYETASEITEALRAKDMDYANRLFDKVAASYKCTVDAIKQLD